ncbi:hypothetical protein F5Y09DRAFT_307999 [Xylaria sp. FL1042]|nr:hypothetical protein F5Y09DRAFT_307999 [Xylaria sp. FL1042]
MYLAWKEYMRLRITQVLVTNSPVDPTLTDKMMPPTPTRFPLSSLRQSKRQTPRQKYPSMDEYLVSSNTTFHDEDPQQLSDLSGLGGLQFELARLACFVCSSTFRNDTELLKHGKDTNHQPYACYCGKTFSRLSTITRHLGSRAAASVTSDASAKYSCPVCTKYDGEKAFGRRDHLLQHLRGHHKFDQKGVAFINASIGRRAPARAVGNTPGAEAQNVPVPQID